MIESFLTIKNECSSEIVIEHSKFIADSFNVVNEEQTAKILLQVRKKYTGANHNCYAYILSPDSNISKNSDDKEPSKTAGYPILETIKGKKLFNTMVVVTRYFGGIKLGTGGLVRAYTEAANKVLVPSGTINYIFSAIYSIETDYTFVSAIERLIILYGVITEKNYYSNVFLVAACPLSKLNELKEKINEATGGKAEFKIINTEYIPY